MPNGFVYNQEEISHLIVQDAAEQCGFPVEELKVTFADYDGGIIATVVHRDEQTDLAEGEGPEVKLE